MRRPDSASTLARGLRRFRWPIVAVFCAVASVLAGLSLAGRGDSSDPTITHQSYVALSSVTGRPYFLFRSTVLDADYGTLEVAPESDPNSRRARTALRCARVAFGGDRGICLAPSQQLFGTARAMIFNGQFQVLAVIPIPGYPNRAAVSPDGHYAALTDFVAGDSYDEASFSTRTLLIDLRSDRILYDLEKLTVTKSGAVIHDVRFNYWGVTFARDGVHFYATLGYAGGTYLIEGDVSTVRAHVVTTGVECPSLSPDGTRIAFKQRVPGPTTRWRLYVLDLSDLRRHPLAETADVDDQAYWLDDSTVAYGLAAGNGGSAGTDTGISDLTAGGSIPTNMWEVPSSGGGHPKELIRGGWSAQIVS